MDNAIKIGHEISKKSGKNLRELIETVFRVGAETRMEQETIKAALTLIGKASRIDNIAISNSNFVGDRHVHLSEDGA